MAFPILSVIKHQLFARLLALAVFAGAETSGQGGLDGGADHHGAVVPVLLQGVEQRGGEAEVALHELLRVLRAVHPGEVEHEVAVAAPRVQFPGRGAEVVFIDGFNLHAAVPARLAVLDVVELGAEVAAHKPLGSGN